MHFDRVYNHMIQEISQDMVNRAVLKHQSYKGKNPIANQRADEFHNAAEKRATKKRTLIRTKTDPHTKSTQNYAYYLLETARINEQKDGPSEILMSSLKYNPFDEDRTSERSMLIYDMNTNKLVQNTGSSPLWLESRTDAENLAHFIRKQTGISVSWKAMDFVSIADSYVDDSHRYNSSKDNSDKYKKFRS